MTEHENYSPLSAALRTSPNLPAEIIRLSQLASWHVHLRTGFGVMAFLEFFGTKGIDTQLQGWLLLVSVLGLIGSDSMKSKYDRQYQEIVEKLDVAPGILFPDDLTSYNS